MGLTDHVWSAGKQSSNPLAFSNICIGHEIHPLQERETLLIFPSCQRGPIYVPSFYINLIFSWKRGVTTCPVMLKLSLRIVERWSDNYPHSEPYIQIRLYPHFNALTALCNIDLILKTECDNIPYKPIPISVDQRRWTEGWDGEISVIFKQSVWHM